MAKKLILLIIVPILSLFIFLTSPPSAQSVVVTSCNITFTPTASAGGTINVEVHGAAFGKYKGLIVDSNDHPAAPAVEAIADSFGKAIITLHSPITPGPYKIGAWDISIDSSDTNALAHSCTGFGPITVQTDVSQCAGLLGCLGSVGVPGLRFTNQSTFIGELVSNILPIILVLGGFITVIIIVISGIQFITSSGNPESAAGARNRLLFAIAGFIIIILAFALTQIVDKLFLRSGVL